MCVSSICVDMAILSYALHSSSYDSCRGIYSKLIIDSECSVCLLVERAQTSLTKFGCSHMNRRMMITTDFPLFTTYHPTTMAVLLPLKEYVFSVISEC